MAADGGTRRGQRADRRPVHQPARRARRPAPALGAADMSRGDEDDRGEAVRLEDRRGRPGEIGEGVVEGDDDRARRQGPAARARVAKIVERDDGHP